MDYLNKLKTALEGIRKITNFVPETGIVLGSGLGAFSKDIRVIGKIPYSRIPGFPVSTVSGHSGQFVFGYVEKIPVVLMEGRVHYYEGYDMQDVVMPVRIMAMLGAKRIVLTNAAGGINRGLYEGSLMLITDHISSFVPSPLIGKNIDEFGERFPDMTNIYDQELRNIALSTARNNQIVLREGVYLQTSGPNYETPAEVRMYATLGADAVGMSTACEAMALRHMGIPVLGISCITNMATGISKKKLSHDEVKETADAVSEKFRKLIWNLIIDFHDNERKNGEQNSKINRNEKEKVSDLNFDEFEIIQL